MGSAARYAQGILQKAAAKKDFTQQRTEVKESCLNWGKIARAMQKDFRQMTMLITFTW